MALAAMLGKLNWQGLRERGWAGRDRAFGLPVRDGVQLAGARPARLADIDHALVLVVLALVLFGLVMVYSASVALPDNPKFAHYASTHFLVRHALWIALARVAWPGAR